MMKRMMYGILAVTVLLSLVACSGPNSGDSQLAEGTSQSVLAAQGEPHTTADWVARYLEYAKESYAFEIAETLAYDPAYLSNELGWRTAGSDAEHAAADFIAKEMEAIGLNTEKVPVTVDKWQFNDASLTIEGTDIDIMPASYATNGTDADGITAELVDVGTGTAAEYEGLDVTGKIVLVGVDQWNEAWIDQYMNEAALHGAVAIVSYDVGGYAAYSDDVINMQDVCAKDVIPCVSISKNHYLELAEALKAGHTTATLMVDNVVELDQGTSYNVVGTLKGRNSDQQIIGSAHYDMYFNGFQDDSCAVGLVMAMAKAMVDAGYQPENDILFIAHGSEEWGASGTQFDWTIGAWEMINTVHPEWAGKTIAMLNFELPAFYDGLAQAKISCVPEFASLTQSFVEESGLLAEPVNGIYPEGISGESVDTNTMEDGVSYRASGVPYFLNIYIPSTEEGESNWMQERYHTAADDRDTYNADVMQTNLNTFGALAIYLDKTPALELDLTATCDDLEQALNLDIAKEAGADTQAYLQAVSQLREAAERWNSSIQDVNTRYEQAVESGASQEKLDEIRAEGRALNKKTLEFFRFVQDEFIGIVFSSTIVIKHQAYQENVELISGVIAALEEGVLANEEETGALDLAWMINGATEYGYYNFSEETNAEAKATLLEESNPGNLFWGTGKGSVLAQTYPATMSLLDKADEEAPVFDEEIALYRSQMVEQQKLMVDTIEKETVSAQELCRMMG